MVINNPYREKVQKDTDILHLSEEIYTHKGKWTEYFSNDNELILEIGTGMGNFFGRQVARLPEKNFIGMEIRYKRLFQSAEKARKGQASHPPSGTSLQGREDVGKTDGMNNFVMLKDFAQNIRKIFIEGEISETYIFFPDPWANKDRQRKHRLLQAEFLKDLYSITKQGGKLFFKTDHREYFDSTREILEKQGLWSSVTWTHNYENSEIFDMNNVTEFEGFYRGENTEINYIELVK